MQLGGIANNFISKSIKKTNAMKRRRKMQITSTNEKKMFFSPKTKKSSKDSVINKKQFTQNIVKGVLLSKNRGSYLQYRFNSPQPNGESLMILPSFDRGRRKISKMGGIDHMFGKSRQVPIMNVSKNITKTTHSRRFTSTSPVTVPKLRANLQKTRWKVWNVQQKWYYLFNDPIGKRSVRRHPRGKKP